MNPYENTNILHPRIQRDYREVKSTRRNSDLEFSLSNAAYRMINRVEQVMANCKH